MDHDSGLPADIQEAVTVIRELKDKPFPSRMDRETLNRAKLRIAFWSCRTENIVASRENLSYVLGSDATEIMSAYDKYLEKEDEREAERGRKKKKGAAGGTQFWENAGK